MSRAWLAPSGRRLLSRGAGPSLAGRRVLVTGASSGIGAATARLLAVRGARLAVAGRDAGALAPLVAAGADAVPGDLRLPGVARATVAAAVDALGGLDVVVANAGVGWAGPFAQMAADDIDELLDVNLRSVGHLLHAAVGVIGPGGRIVVVGSIAGRLGVAEEVWYSATKAGLAGLASALRAEVGPAGIGVTLVTPGVVATNFFERRNRGYQRQRPRPVPAERLGAAIVAAIEAGRDEVTVPRWLEVPVRLQGLLPGTYRRLAGHFG